MYRAAQEITSNHLSILTGVVSLVQTLRKYGLQGLNAFGKGCVPWYFVLGLSIWRAQVDLLLGPHATHVPSTNSP